MQGFNKRITLIDYVCSIIADQSRELTVAVIASTLWVRGDPIRIHMEIATARERLAVT